MSTVRRFEDLRVWQGSREICKQVFLLTKKDAFSKDFDMKRQILRSSGSTMDNIAEGFEREGNREFKIINYFLWLELGSDASAH